MDSVWGKGSHLCICEPPPSGFQSNVVQFGFNTVSPKPSAAIMHSLLVAEIPGCFMNFIHYSTYTHTNNAFTFKWDS